MLAGVIPLTGTALMVAVSPENLPGTSYRAFRLLVTGLIALGMLGCGLALSANDRLRQTLTALTGGDKK